MTRDSAAHYQKVTALWREFMGDHFHFGYFRTGEESLSQAALDMVEELLRLCELDANRRVLDVGCGIGGAAFYIHERYGCAVDGISNSEVGVRIAEESSRERGCDAVRFKVADALRNGFPDETFDLVWIMEASHPIEDKAALSRECFRVLKKGGRLAMCDLVQLRTLPFREGLRNMLANLGDFLFAPKVWGPAHISTLGKLCDILVDTGFTDLRVVNVTDKVTPTLKYWRENALRFLERAGEKASRHYAADFARACTSLEKAFRDGVMGYGMISALK